MAGVCKWLSARDCVCACINVNVSMSLSVSKTREKWPERSGRVYRHSTEIEVKLKCNTPSLFTA